MVEAPLELVKKQLQDGIAIPSFISYLLEDEKFTPQDEHRIKWTALAIYGGGGDTTVSAVYSFFLARTLYPEPMRKAQKEIDEVIGRDRLPTLADWERLPYVNALVKEVLRFNPVANLCIPHKTTHDNIYAGYFVPKGSAVIANIWAFLHDPDIYPEPFKFIPERFLGPNPQRDPREFAFGHGRR
ncbi:hypothetical protein QCA50_000265 [Cerrena zonata]|uniref:Cytochrome P450 n=1 Tax=Cerrena zonata TaxID=2478898 RepID=A0AAW0GW99_9APHY